VKVAFVLGFYNPVESALRAEFGAELSRGCLVWLGQQSRNRPFNLNEFRGRLRQTLNDSTCDPILVLLAEVRGQEWVKPSVEGIVSSSESTGSQPRVVISTLKNAQESQSVVTLLKEFGLEARNDAITGVMLSTFLGGATVLCVRAMWQPNFADAFRRARIPADLCGEQFIERTIHSGQNPNLIRELCEAACQYGVLLYAWKGLRTMPADAKRRFAKGVFEAETPAKVVALFKNGVLGLSPTQGRKPSRG